MTLTISCIIQIKRYWLADDEDYGIVSMWSPTNVNVIIRKATNLVAKGKNETNNAFVVIELGKESYRTSIKENVGTKLTVWQEECEFKIPSSGNTACVVITAFHRNAYGFDSFLGFVSIPLSSFDKNDNSTRWYKLQSKPGKTKVKDVNRGMIEVTVQFISKPSHSPNLVDNEKKSLSFGSILSIRKGDKVLSFRDLKKKAFGKKLKLSDGKTPPKPSANPDPGVVTDDEEDHEDANEDVTENNSTSKISIHSGGDEPPLKPPRIFASHHSLDKPHLERKLSNSLLDLREVSKSPKDIRKCLSSLALNEPEKNIFTKFSKKLKQKSDRREQDGQKQPKSVLAQFNNKSREELIAMIIELQRKVNKFHVQVMDLEEYLDRLLLKIMETSPTLLEK